MKPLSNIFEEIVGLENLFRAADATLKRGRRFRGEGSAFKFNLEKEVLKLHDDLVSGRYRHGKYRLFTVWDPKVRVIAAAPVRDRVVHHAVHDVIEPRLDRMFIHDSYACRREKGTYRALDRAHGFLRANRYGLHLDVKSYFATIDHEILKELLRRYVADASTLALLEQIVDSTDYLARKGGVGAGVSSVTGSIVSQMEFDFEGLTDGGDLNKEPRRDGCGTAGTWETTAEPAVSKGSSQWVSIWSRRSPPEQGHRVRGIPLGNLTSQFFANLYLNELDQYVKHRLRVRYYARYMDDLLLFADDKEQMHEWEEKIRSFVQANLRLELHPGGGPRPVKRGIGFLGFRLFPGYRKLKCASVTRFIRRMNLYTRAYYALRPDRESQAVLLREIGQSAQSFHAHALNGDTYGIRRRLYDRFPIINQYALPGMRGRWKIRVSGGIRRRVWLGIRSKRVNGNAADRGENVRPEQVAFAEDRQVSAGSAVPAG